jgi:hypothetical protein
MDVVAHRECAADPPEPGAAFGAGTQNHPCQQEQQRHRDRVVERVRHPPVHPAGVSGRHFRRPVRPFVDPLDRLDTAVDAVELRVVRVGVRCGRQCVRIVDPAVDPFCQRRRVTGTEQVPGIERELPGGAPRAVGDDRHESTCERLQA